MTPPPIRVDYRHGSGELIPFIASHGVEYQPDDLAEQGGDFAFDGHGPKGLSMIGIERKRIKDFLGNMRNNHLVGLQIPRMINHYDIRYVLIEGIVRANPDTGTLEEPGKRDPRTGKRLWREVMLGRSTFQWEDFEKYITSLEWAPIRILRTPDPETTARLVVAKYRWYQKQWNEHHSLKGLYYTPYPIIPINLGDKEDLNRLMMSCLPHIGPEKSLMMAMRWKCMVDLCQATMEDLQDLPGIGRVISQDIHNFLRGLPWGKEE